MDARRRYHASRSAYIGRFRYLLRIFFTPPIGRGAVGSGEANNSADKRKEGETFASMSLAEVAIEVLQGERWRGNEEQVVDFIRRLAAGRSESLIKKIAAVRDSFETLLVDKDACDVSLSDLDTLFSTAKLPGAAVNLSIEKFTSRLERQARATFSLPELFEFFGSIITEVAEGSVGVAEVFAMLRLHYNTTEVRTLADVAMKTLTNILQHSSDPKYWVVNIKAEEFYTKVWMKDEGKGARKGVQEHKRSGWKTYTTGGADKTQHARQLESRPDLDLHARGAKGASADILRQLDAGGYYSSAGEVMTRYTGVRLRRTQLAALAPST